MRGLPTFPLLLVAFCCGSLFAQWPQSPVPVPVGGGGGGSGTVTSAACNGSFSPNWLTCSFGGAATVTPVLQLTPATGLTANQFLGTPNGTPGAVGLRALVAGDIPALSYQAPLSNYSTISALAGYPSTFPPTTTGLCLLSGCTFSGAVSLGANQLTSTVTTGTAPFVVASTTQVANLNAASLGGATFAAPGAIGGGTPNTGNFTTLSATGGITAGPDGTHAGAASLYGNTALPTVASNLFSLFGPSTATFTSYGWQVPSTAPGTNTVPLFGAASGGASPMTYVSNATTVNGASCALAGTCNANWLNGAVTASHFAIFNSLSGDIKDGGAVGTASAANTASACSAGQVSLGWTNGSNNCTATPSATTFTGALAGNATTATTATNLAALTGIPAQAADTVVMNATGGSAAPTAVAMPTCTTGAVLYNTSTHAWSCVTTGSSAVNYIWTGSLYSNGNVNLSAVSETCYVYPLPIPYTAVVSNFGSRVATADASLLNDIGIYGPNCAGGASCPMVAHTGAIHFSPTGSGATFTAALVSSPITIQPGMYYLVTTGTSTTAQLATGSNGEWILPFSASTVASCGSAGALPSTITMPSAGFVSFASSSTQSMPVAVFY